MAIRESQLVYTLLLMTAVVFALGRLAQAESQ
jgi:hypothetical protein